MGNNGNNFNKSGILDQKSWNNSEKAIKKKVISKEPVKVDFKNLI